MSKDQNFKFDPAKSLFKACEPKKTSHKINQL